MPFSIAPKPPKEDNRTHWWRVDFYDLGDRVFRDRVNMKNTIRLLKVSAFVSGFPHLRLASTAASVKEFSMRCILV